MNLCNLTKFLDLGQNGVLPKVENLDLVHELKNFYESFQIFIGSTEASSKPDNLNASLSKPAPLKAKNSRLIPPSLKQTYEFRLKLKTTIQETLCKCKYFAFKVFLESASGCLLPVNQQVQLEILVYSQEKAKITKNMRGEDILKGNSTQSMSFFVAEDAHVAYFRVQVTEVSSHYVGKRIDLKVKARSSEFLQEQGWNIQPLWIRGIVVKAKDYAKKGN